MSCSYPPSSVEVVGTASTIAVPLLVHGMLGMKQMQARGTPCKQGCVYVA